MPSIVWKPATWQTVITESDGSEGVETEKGIRLGNWGVCKDKRTGKWAVCLITFEARRAHMAKSMAEAKALVEAFGVEDPDLLLIKGESELRSRSNTLLQIIRNPKIWKGEHKPTQAEGKEMVQQFLSANLQPLGTYNGKAGEFWGVIKGGDKGARAISLGAREVLLNVFYVQQEVDRSKPDTRWLMQKSELITKITEDTLKKWAAWVKAGPTMKELRQAARERALSGQNAYLSGASSLKTAMEFQTEEALQKYLSEHSNASKADHTVKKQKGRSRDEVMKDEMKGWGDDYRTMSAKLHMAADPTYKDYVEKKKKDGEKHMEKDEWESKVLGKGKDKKKKRLTNLAKNFQHFVPEKMQESPEKLKEIQKAIQGYQFYKDYRPAQPLVGIRDPAKERQRQTHINEIYRKKKDQLKEVPGGGEFFNEILRVPGHADKMLGELAEYAEDSKERSKASKLAALRIASQYIVARRYHP